MDTALYKNLPLLAFLCSGNDLQDFYIKVGPYNGEFGSCGFENNTVPSASSKAFGCNPNAKGSALEILLLGNIEQYLALCEVLVHGNGEVWGWKPYRKMDIDMLERVQRRATKIIPKSRNIIYEMRLKECGLTRNQNICYIILICMCRKYVRWVHFFYVKVSNIQTQKHTHAHARI